MPKMPPRPCNQPRCRNMATKNGRCDDHQVQAWASSSGKTAAERGYGSKWKKLRDSIMRRDKHLCQECLRAGIVTPAKAVDHILNKARGGTDHPSNLEAICEHCHQEKTNRERRDGK